MPIISQQGGGTVSAAAIVAAIPTIDIDWTDDVTTFLLLTDTPNSFVGHGAKLLGVNVAENAVEFVAAPAGNFVGLTDTPASLVGQGGRLTAVNAGETAIEFTNPPTGYQSSPGYASAYVSGVLRVGSLQSNTSVSATTTIVSSGTMSAAGMISTTATVSGANLSSSATISGVLFESISPGSGIILTDPAGGRWALSVNTIGNLVILGLP